MALMSISGLSMAFGGSPLLDGVHLHLERGDRACLVGRNGAGKTTLMLLLAGELEPDGGTITRAPGTTVSYLPQVIPRNIEGTVAEVVRSGLAGHERRVSDPERQLQKTLTVLELDAEASFASLSGGMKRRTLLGRALVAEPDILLLDEPTNHLDIPSIQWLEEFLKRYVKTFLFVTHDRRFLRNLATRIIDLDRGQLADWRCDYDTFLQRKQELINDEDVRNRRFDKKLTKEEVWIRQGIKARRTRDEGRVRALMAMRSERAARREKEGTARVQLQEAALSGRLVVEAKQVAFAYEGQPLVTDFSIRIMRGDRVGILGPNGCGKTTLLRLLLGEHALDPSDREQPQRLDHRTFTFEMNTAAPRGLQPDSGNIRHGTKLAVAYFDQHRQQLDDDATVFDSVADGSDSVTIDGSPRNVYGYLQDFLFTPDRARAPVGILSGGERNRLLLARLFARPSNLIVMDEPTNDLDIETLELLEEQLLAYNGTLLLVSHDREFINNVVTSTLVFEQGRLNEYVGGYDDWLRQRPEPKTSTRGGTNRQVSPKAERRRGRSLTNKEREEWRKLPQQIETLEREQQELHDAMAEADFYRQDPAKIAAARARVTQIDKELESAFERWAALEALQQK